MNVPEIMKQLTNARVLAKHRQTSRDANTAVLTAIADSINKVIDEVEPYKDFRVAAILTVIKKGSSLLTFPGQTIQAEGTIKDVLTSSIAMGRLDKNQLMMFIDADGRIQIGEIKTFIY